MPTAARARAEGHARARDAHNRTWLPWSQEAELSQLHGRIMELEKRRSFAKMQISQHEKGASVPEKHESGQVTDHSVWNQKGYFCASGAARGGRNRRHVP